MGESKKMDKSIAYQDGKLQELIENQYKFEKFTKDKFGQVKL